MTLLNELIERLYQEATTSTTAVEASVSAPAAQTTDKQTNAHTERIRRVLIEMRQQLRQGEEPDTDDEAPTDEICLRILNHWEQQTLSIKGIKQHMDSLENDIATMQPWGDFDVVKVEELAAYGIYLHFWKIARRRQMEIADGDCPAETQIHIISQDADWTYFVTSDDEKTPPSWLQQTAEPVRICPCPVSTLIMLQTRDKDTLRRMESLLGDYALAHYSEMYAALRQLLPAGVSIDQMLNERKSLRQKIRNLFNK